MIILQKGNVQKIVASKNQADKLVCAGFEVIEQDKDTQSEYVCPVCQKTYKTQEGLDKHMTDKHPKKGGDSNGTNPTSNNVNNNGTDGKAQA